MQPNSPGTADRDMAHFQVLRQEDLDGARRKEEEPANLNRGPVAVSVSSPCWRVLSLQVVSGLLAG